jgi:hypothetical protein
MGLCGKCHGGRRTAIESFLKHPIVERGRLLPCLSGRSTYASESILDAGSPSPFRRSFHKRDIAFFMPGDEHVTRGSHGCLKLQELPIIVLFRRQCDKAISPLSAPSRQRPRLARSRRLESTLRIATAKVAGRRASGRKPARPGGRESPRADNFLLRKRVGCRSCRRPYPRRLQPARGELAKASKRQIAFYAPAAPPTHQCDIIFFVVKTAALIPSRHRKAMPD